MYQFRNIVIGAAAVLAFSVPAAAQPVHIEGDPCTIPLVEDNGGTVEVTDFELIGRSEPGVLAIQFGSVYRHVREEDLLALLPELDLSGLQDGSALTDVRRGEKGEAAQGIQQALIGLGYLTGKADGIYGGGTAQAVSRFQKEHRLAETGDADVNTQIAMAAVAAGNYDQEIVVEYEENLTPEMKFGMIIDQVDGNLENYMDRDWSYQYDAYEGKGKISTGLKIGRYQVIAPDIDQIVIELGLDVVLAYNEGEGRIRLIPAVTTESQGAYRPYIQGIVLTKGSEVCRLENAVASGGLVGTALMESAYIPLKKEAADFLTDADEIKARLVGKNNSYDLTLSGLEGIGEFLAAAEGDIAE